MRKILVSLALAATMAASAAELKWALKTQSGETVFMSQVEYILYSDGSSTMSIVKKDNSTVDDVTKVSFVKVEDTGIGSAPVNEGVALLSRAVKESLTLTGCKQKQTVTVVSAAGATVLQAVTQGDKTTLDVSRLASGVYMLNVGKTTIKFIKK